MRRPLDSFGELNDCIHSTIRYDISYRLLAASFQLLSLFLPVSVFFVEIEVTVAKQSTMKL